MSIAPKMRSIHNRSYTLMIPRKFHLFYMLVVLPLVGLFLYNTWEVFLTNQLHHSIINGDSNQVKNLLKLGADPNRGWTGTMGESPLIWATMDSNNSIIDILISGGSDINNKDRSGYTALMYVKSPQTADFLLRKGADPGIRSEEGLTAWQYMKYSKLEKVAEVIMHAENRKYKIGR
ncbi:MAG: ankyrin repeat domain-containing protein [Proteobacteria bacterium]|nr:MAG: ankyrin repeat domain-containing protein [Pseudomonadota bacterium]